MSQMNSRTKWTLVLSIGLAPACASMPVVETVRYYDIVPRDTDGNLLEDTQLDQLFATVDSLLNPLGPDPLPPGQAYSYVRTFREAFERGRITPQQADRVFAFFHKLKSEHPGSATFIEEQRHLFSILTPGMVAQNIVGTDTDGVEFALEDYRGNIVVLVFSGEWCAPCRAEYPYQRELMEKYKDEPVLLLGVNSDKELKTIREAKTRESLGYRTWWDGSTSGPISQAWSVRSWPSTFILDADGVIRFVDKRQDRMFEAVDRLLAERTPSDWPTAVAGVILQ